MAYSRFFLMNQLASHEEGSHVAVEMTPEDLKHASVVLRLTHADRIVVVEPAGEAFLVALDSIDKRGITARVIEPIAFNPLPDVTLVQGISKGERMDLCIRMAVEVGVSRIVPVLTERSIVKLDEEGRTKKSQRWTRIALAAAKQSGRASIPPVDTARDLEAILGDLKMFDVVLVAWEDATSGSIGEALRARSVPHKPTVAIVIGPEGGLTQGEVDLLTANGATVISLGDTVLRTETAGPIACALAIYELGGLGNATAIDPTQPRSS